MGFTLKENESEARERLHAFWAGSSLGRPALCVKADRPGFVKREWPHPELSMKQRDFMPEWWEWKVDRYFQSTLFLAEAMPDATLDWGNYLITVATLAGGDYEWDGTETAWIVERPDLYEQELPVFDPKAPVAAAMEACLRHVAEVVGDRGFVNPPVMLDGLTDLSLFRGPQQLCYEVVERPEDVRRWSDAMTSIYIDAYGYFYGLLKQLGYGDACTWLQVMAEGRLEAVQCDFSVMLSPALYDRFAMPDLRRLTEYFDFTLYHLDGTCQMRFLDQLRSLHKLTGIQWNPEPPAGSPVGWIDAFKEIRRRNFVLWVDCESVAEAVRITEELGPDGLFLVLPRFKSSTEAEQAIRDIERVC